MIGQCTHLCYFFFTAQKAYIFSVSQDLEWAVPFTQFEPPVSNEFVGELCMLSFCLQLLLIIPRELGSKYLLIVLSY